MKIKMQDKFLGEGMPSFIIAEIGSNHNQDFSVALKLIDKAAEAGVDAVKFQTFKADSHISKFAQMPNYMKGYNDIHKLIKSLELNREWQSPLKDYAEEKGLIFFSSPCDCEAVDQLESLGVPAHKVASFDLPDLDLIRYIAKTNKPVFLSTGLADWMEIQRALDVCRQEGNEKIILFQCTSLYPAPPSLSNLRAIQTMKTVFNVLTGYSDHTVGDNVPLAAVSMGAVAIEKHFTLDRKMTGPDHAFAIEPDELKLMMKKIREIETAFGDGTKAGPREQEHDLYFKARRSLHAAIDIKKGEIISEKMLISKRPGFGIPIFQKNIVIGRKAQKNIDKDSWISWDFI